MEVKENLESLRSMLKEKHSDAERATLWIKVIYHHDASFGDLLDALEYKLLAREHAALELHKALKIESSSGEQIIQDRGEWEEILESRQIYLRSKVR